MLLSIILLIGFLLFSNVSKAADRFVANDGTGDCTSTGTSIDAPCDGSNQTYIQNAYNALACGDTLTFDAGLYPPSGTFTSDPIINADTTGCTSVDPITITSYDFSGSTNGVATFVGSRTISSEASGNNFVNLRDGVDYHTFSNMDATFVEFGIITGTSSAVEGQNDGFRADNLHFRSVRVGYEFAGDDNGVCGPGDGCTEPPVGASTDASFNNVSVVGFSLYGIRLRNGVNGAEIRDSHFDGGGAAFDVSSSGQTAIDVGYSSGGNETPDQGISIINTTCQDVNNRQQAGSRQGDCFKNESTTTGTIDGGWATLASDGGVDSKGGWTIKNFVSYRNLHLFKSYSTQANPTVLINVLGHTQQSNGGTQTGAAVKAFGFINIYNSTLFGTQANSLNFFHLIDTFGTAKINLHKTVYGWDDTGGTSVSLTNGSLSSIEIFHDDDNYAYCYDGEDGNGCNGKAGADPGFSDPDKDHDGDTIAGSGWDSDNHGLGIGYREGGIPSTSKMTIKGVTLRGVTING